MLYESRSERDCRSIDIVAAGDYVEINPTQEEGTHKSIYCSSIVTFVRSPLRTCAAIALFLASNLTQRSGV